MARLSLYLLSVTTLSSCLVAEPPQYEAPQRTPPFLDLGNAHPSNVEIFVYDTTLGNTQPFSVPFRSEDQGFKVWGLMYLDYTFKGEQVVGLNVAPASTMDDLSRELHVDITPNLGNQASAGCHSLTLVAAHEDSVDYPVILPGKQGDTAFATWWINLNPRPGSDPHTLFDCPNRSEVEGTSP